MVAVFTPLCAYSFRHPHFWSLQGNGNPAELEADVLTGTYFLRLADQRVRHSLAALTDNNDDETTATADAVLKGF